MIDLDVTRQKIDAIDADLVALLEERMQLVNDVVAYKKTVGKPILDTSREHAVLQKVQRHCAYRRDCAIQCRHDDRGCCSSRGSPIGSGKL